MNDNEIIALYFNRDENAIKQTKTKYRSKLSGLSFKILKSSEDCEECVSDTYLKAWNTIPPQKPSFLFAYLAKICRFICFGKLDYDNDYLFFIPPIRRFFSILVFHGARGA